MTRLSVAIVLLAGLVAVAAPAVSGQRTPASGGLEADVDVFVAGADGYHTYRIPSLLRTPQGALLAFAEGRRGGRGDAGDIDLVLKRSEDEGRTWSALQVIGDNGPNTFGNPCPVVDRRTGTIVLLTTHNRGEDGEQAILDGTSAGSRTVWLLRSTDDGRTWSPPRDITGDVKRPDWTWYATGPGVGIQLASGRLVVPANHALAGSKGHRSHLLLSDDDGASWRIGAIATVGTNESQVAELADQRLLLNMRNHPPLAENFRQVAISRDGGETLGPTTPDRALPEPPAQASLIRLPAGDPHGQLAFANPAGPGRSHLTLRLSRDGGATWPVQRVLHEGPAAYSSLAALGAGRLGVLYERGTASPYETIRFARVRLDAIGPH